MVDSKITALTNEPTPVAADLVAIVDNVSVSPTSKKATIDNVLNVYNNKTATMTNKIISQSQITDLTTDLALKSPLASPTFTGTVVLPNVPVIVTTQLDLKATLASPVLTSPSISYAINAQTDNYTTVLADAGKIITSNKGSAVVITIPLNSSVAYPIGSSINVISIGAGLTNFAIGAGVTINSTGAVPAAPVLRIAHSSATAIKIATDTWQVVGDIS